MHGRGVVGQARRLPFFSEGTVIVCVVAAVVSGGSVIYSAGEDTGSYNRVAHQQVPGWSKGDLNFFLHGSPKWDANSPRQIEAATAKIAA
jgi:hypothetical protein